jgi:hypothetical protein
MIATVSPPRAAHIARSFLIVAVGLVFAAHFALTTLYDLPHNPISARYRALTQAYVLPLFSQNWSFFAPTPPNRDDFLIARYRLAPDRHGVVRYSSWVSLSLALNADVQGNRFSPMEIVQLMTSNVVNDMNPYFSRFVVRTLADTRLVPIGRFPVEIQMLYREIMASRGLLPGTLRTASVDAVQLAVVHHFYPRFTERYVPDDLQQHNSINYLPWVRYTPVPGFAREARS